MAGQPRRCTGAGPLGDAVQLARVSSLSAHCPRGLLSVAAQSAEPLFAFGELRFLRQLGLAVPISPVNFHKHRLLLR